MMPWALVFAADMAAGLTLEPKNLRRNEMVGDVLSFNVAWWVVSLGLFMRIQEFMFCYECSLFI